MNDNMMVYVNVDQGSDSFNSSSATLLFSNENNADHNCTQVLFAGLYWSGRGPENTVFTVSKNGTEKSLDKQEVLLKGPKPGATTQVRASEDEIRFPVGLDLDNDLGMFVGFAEVTDFVRENGEGEYTVSDIALNEGTNYHYGGWSMVVVYENPMMNQREITVFDGYAFVRGSVQADFTIPISGFTTVEDGPVNVKLGIMAGEGDVAALGDYLEIEKGIGTGDFVRLSHGNNSENNFFNSSIFTGGNPRLPELKNNTGMDIAVFDVPNANNEVITNGQTSTKFRYGTDGDAYVIYNITMAVDANGSELEALHQIKSVNGEVWDGQSPIYPNDELELTVEIRNKGDVPIEDANLEIPLPVSVEFITAKGDVFFTDSNAKAPLVNSDDNGHVVWEIDNLPLPTDADQLLALLTYKVKVTTACSVLINFCNLGFSLDGEIKGINAMTGNSFSPIRFLTGKQESGPCLESPIYGPISFLIDANEYLKSSCSFDSEAGKIQVCMIDSLAGIDFSVIQDYFPEDAKIFNEYPVTSNSIEYGPSTTFPYSTAENYFAVYPDGTECYREFSFDINELEAEVFLDQVNCSEELEEIEVRVDVLNGTVPYEFFWNGDLNGISSHVKKLKPGQHDVMVIDGLGCQKKLVFEIPEFSPFELILNDNESNLEIQCFGSNDGILHFDVRGDEGIYLVNVEGILDDGSQYSSLREDGVVGVHFYSELAPGIYSISIENQSGCRVEKEVTIIQINNPQSEVYFDFTSISLPVLGYTLTNSDVEFRSVTNSIAVQNYLWDFGDGEMSNLPNPVHQYNKSGLYKVELILTDEAGCKATHTEYIQVEGGFFLRMPNAFAPNGDGINDYFFPVFNQLNSLEFWVFNLWGELIFYTENLDDLGWDGNLNNGQAPVGSYVYKVQYVTGQGIGHNQSGSFLLIR
jgi:gliding motility-associated-like protein